MLKGGHVPGPEGKGICSSSITGTLSVRIIWPACAPPSLPNFNFRKLSGPVRRRSKAHRSQQLCCGPAFPDQDHAAASEKIGHVGQIAGT